MSATIAIAVALIVVWGLAYFVFKVTKGLIHIALVVGAVLLVLHFVRG
jgi:uncharacterized protein DUF5670